MTVTIARALRGAAIGLIGMVCLAGLTVTGAFAGEAPELAKLVEEGKLPPLVAAALKSH